VSGWIALLVACELLFPRPGVALDLPTRARLAQIEVIGPLRDLELSVGAAGTTRVAGELLAGERQRLVVPVPVRSSSPHDPPPRISWPASEGVEEAGLGRGSARFLGWGARPSAVEELPAGLLARPRPPVESDPVRLPLATLALLPGAFVLALAIRRRRVPSILVSLGSAGLVLVLAGRRGETSEVGPRETWILELARGSAVGLEVRTSFGRATLEAHALAETALVTDPEDARVVWDGSFQAGAAWTARAPRAIFHTLRAVPSAAFDFAPDANRVGPLAQSWVRDGGAWTARGPWRLGERLPAPREGPPPPGWLAAGLPQGVGVLLGRLESADPKERGRLRRDRGDGWVRLTGFQP
jgi:hypothetical protein